MGFRTLQACLDDLEQHKQLIRIDTPLSAHLEIGAVQRRVFQAGGPALLFTQVKECAFPMAGNIFGTPQRIRHIFRDTLRRVEALLRIKANPAHLFRQPVQNLKKYAKLPATLLHTLPKTAGKAPVFAHQTSISALPQLVSWPQDGGAYVTLPQVYTEDPARPGLMHSNLGMYRIQLSGASYTKDKEVGLHYQIHRGIGPHHASALERGEALRVNVFVGGPPALTVAAVMPLPEGIAEILFAGALAGHRIPFAYPPHLAHLAHRKKDTLPVPAEADFCLCGYIQPQTLKPEGPFGDHLGYYSLAHDFPVMTVEAVYHRQGAVWPFTTVGRPPQEDTVFGSFIHELTAELVPTVFSGVHEVHAVDQAGVHPLLLAVGSERYVPYAQDRIPQELITCGLSLLGTTQTSLSKYLLIAAREDSPELSAHDIPAFITHMLERTDFTRDLHFITRTTMDTLDYSGISLNQGSKLLWTACGPPKRTLSHTLPDSLPLPRSFADLRLFSPGILLVQGPAHTQQRDTPDPLITDLTKALEQAHCLKGFPLVVVVDDTLFCATNWDNFLWAVFTRSDPATDIYGTGETIHCKHWGCTGPLVIDARIKTCHAPALEMDPATEKYIEALAVRGGPLHGLF